MKPGDHVECKCSPRCEASWDIPGAIDGPEHGRPAKHGPCIRGTVVRFRKSEDGVEALIRQDHGGVKVYAPIGYGQYAARTYAAEVWTLFKGLRPLPRQGTTPEEP